MTSAIQTHDPREQDRLIHGLGNVGGVFRGERQIGLGIGDYLFKKDRTIQGFRIAGYSAKQDRLIHVFEWLRRALPRYSSWPNDKSQSDDRVLARPFKAGCYPAWGASANIKSQSDDRTCRNLAVFGWVGDANGSVVALRLLTETRRLLSIVPALKGRAKTRSSLCDLMTVVASFRARCLSFLTGGPPLNTRAFRRSATCYAALKKEIPCTILPFKNGFKFTIHSQTISHS